MFRVFSQLGVSPSSERSELCGVSEFGVSEFERFGAPSARSSRASSERSDRLLKRFVPHAGVCGGELVEPDGAWPSRRLRGTIGSAARPPAGAHAAQRRARGLELRHSPTLRRGEPDMAWLARLLAVGPDAQMDRPGPSADRRHRLRRGQAAGKVCPTEPGIAEGARRPPTSAARSTVGSDLPAHMSGPKGRCAMQMRPTKGAFARRVGPQEADSTLDAIAFSALLGNVQRSGPKLGNPPSSTPKLETLRARKPPTRGPSA